MLLLTVCLPVLLYCGVEGQDQVRQADPGHHHLLHPQLQSLYCGPALIPVLTGRKVSSLKYNFLLSLVSPWSEVSRFGPLELNIFLSCGNKILVLQVQTEGWLAAGATVLADDPQQPGEPRHLPGLQQGHALLHEEEPQLQLGSPAPDLSDLRAQLVLNINILRVS